MIQVDEALKKVKDFESRMLELIRELEQDGILIDQAGVTREGKDFKAANIKTSWRLNNIGIGSIGE